MNCSRCKKEHRGIEGLMPVDSGKHVKSTAGTVSAMGQSATLPGIRIFWYLCSDCLGPYLEHRKHG